MAVELRTATEGQTLGQIAAEFADQGVTAQDIWNYFLNGAIRQGRQNVTDPAAVVLKEGEKVYIVVPDPPKEVECEAPGTPYPYDLWLQRPRKPRAPKEGCRLDEYVLYTMKEGDTLEDLAEKTKGAYTPDDILFMNFGTRNQKQINWYLREHSKCTEPNDDASSWDFKGGEQLWIPDKVDVPLDSEPPPDIEQEQTKAATGVSVTKELQFALEMGVVTHGTWLPNAEVWYEGKIEWTDPNTGTAHSYTIGNRGRYWKIKEVPGNLLGEESAFIKIIPLLPAMEQATIDLKVEAWARNVGSFEKLGEAKAQYAYDTNAGWTREAFRLVPESDKFAVYAKVDPMEDRVITGTPVFVSRQHRTNPGWSKFSDENVEVGFIVRGMRSEDENPSFKQQAMGSHADMTLPTDNGNHTKLVGFFGHTHIPVGKLKNAAATYIGQIAGYINVDDDFQTDREHYYDKDVARDNDVVSLLAKIPVRPSQAEVICSWWDEYYQKIKQWEADRTMDQFKEWLDNGFGVPEVESKMRAYFDRKRLNLTEWKRRVNAIRTAYGMAASDEERAQLEQEWEWHLAPYEEVYKQAQNEWMRTHPHPLPYILAGGNCSSRAADSLIAGDVIHSVNGIDTPFHVYKSIKKIYGDKIKCEVGYLGFNDAGVYGAHPGYEYVAAPPTPPTPSRSAQAARSSR